MLIPALKGRYLLTFKYTDTLTDFQEMHIRQSRILHSVMLVMESFLFGMFVIAIACDQFDAIFTGKEIVCTERFIYYRKYVLHPRKRMVHARLSRCGTDLR